MEYAIIGMAVLFFGGHALQWLFAKTKIPDLLLLTAIGYLIGPVFGIVDQSHLGQVGNLLSTVALIVILYEAGLQLSTKDLKESWLPSLVLAILSFTSISIIAITLTSPIVGWPYSLLVAFGIGSTSSAIVIPMVKFLSIKQKTKTVLSLESAFTDIFAIVLFLVVLEGLLAGNMDAYSIFFNVGPKTFISMGSGILLAFVWAAIKKYLPVMTKIRFAGEAWALFSYGLIQLMGLNGAMGVLCLGFCLANLNLLPKWMTQFFSKVPVTYEEMEILGEITFLLKTFFFLYLGMLIQLGNIWLVSVGAILALAIFATRYLVVRLIFTPKRDYSLMDALTLSSMGPRGLACAVLATLPARAGFESGDKIQQIIFATIPISILLTALFVFLSEQDSFRKMISLLYPKYLDGGSSSHENDL